MRLFYIIFFFLVSISFSGYATSKKEITNLKSKLKETFVSSKKNAKIIFHLQQDQESLEKDFITISKLKTVTSCFILFAVLAFFLSANKISNTKVIINTIRFSYWCLFKMLYPKHVFW